MTPAPTRSRRLPGQIRSPPFKLLLTIINFYADMSFDSSSKIFDCRPPLPAPHNFPRSFRYIVTSLHPYLTIASFSCPDPVGVAADDRRFRPVGQGAYLERPSGTRDSASAAASWCRLSAGENHVQVQTSIVVAASSGMDFAGEGAVRAHGPQTDCRCGRQTAPSSRYKPGELDGAGRLYVAVPGRPA